MKKMTAITKKFLGMGKGIRSNKKRRVLRKSISYPAQKERKNSLSPIEFLKRRKQA